jgi:excisionase family DNA binding protein
MSTQPTTERAFLSVAESSRKRRSPRRKPPFVPTFPDGLTIREKLLRIDKPITAPILASILGVSAVTIFKKAKSGVLPCIRIGSAVRFDTRQIARWLDGKRASA